MILITARKPKQALGLGPFIGWSDVTVVCGHITISKLWGNTKRCRLSNIFGNTGVLCEVTWWRFLSSYSNKIELVGLRKCPYFHCLSKKVMSQWQTFRNPCSILWRKNSRHRYGMKKLRHGHPLSWKRTTPIIIKPKHDPGRLWKDSTHQGRSSSVRGT